MTGRADLTVTVRLDPEVKASLATVADDAWTPIEDTDAICCDQPDTWASRAEIALNESSSHKEREQLDGRVANLGLQRR